VRTPRTWPRILERGPRSKSAALINRGYSQASAHTQCKPGSGMTCSAPCPEADRASNLGQQRSIARGNAGEPRRLDPHARPARPADLATRARHAALPPVAPAPPRPPRPPRWLHISRSWPLARRVPRLLAAPVRATTAASADLTATSHRDDRRRRNHHSPGARRPAPRGDTRRLRQAFSRTKRIHAAAHRNLWIL
jgi:hypothetical protein